MFRYFIELSYLGTNYCGLQKQINATTIEGVLQKTLKQYFAQQGFDNLTCASRTDTGVHARKNIFHIDFFNPLSNIEKNIHNLNSMLPYDVAIQKIYSVNKNMHARFDATYRQYKYYLSKYKNPFYEQTTLYYPYTFDLQILQQCATFILSQNNFTSFCKSHTQNKTPYCKILESEWVEEKEFLIYSIQSNRFLRGMVRALVATMLRCGREKINIENFKNLFVNPILSSAFFDVDGKGLFLEDIVYPF